MIRSIVTAALCASLAACGAAPIITTRTERVEVPVPVPCRVEGVAKPSYWPTDRLTQTSTIGQKIIAALEEIELRRAYEAEIEAALLACS